MAQWAITASRVGGGESTPRISDAVTRVERARGDPWAPQRDPVPNTRDDGRRSSLRRLDRTSRRARRTAGRTRDWVWRGRGTGTGSLVGHGTRGAGGTAQRSEREDRAQSLRGQSGGARPLKPPTRRAPTRRRSGAVGAERVDVHVPARGRACGDWCAVSTKKYHQTVISHIRHGLYYVNLNAGAASVESSDGETQREIGVEAAGRPSREAAGQRTHL